MLVLIAVAGAVGLACHWAICWLGGRGGFVRYILVSAMSSLVTAWCFFIYNYIQLGEFPEPPAGAVIIMVLSFPVGLAAGIPFLVSQWRKANQNPPVTIWTNRQTGQVRLFWKLCVFAGFAMGGLFVAALVGAVSQALMRAFDHGDITSNFVASLLAMVALVVSSWACLVLFDRQPLSALGIGWDRPWLRESLIGLGIGGLLFSLVIVVCWLAGWVKLTVNPFDVSQGQTYAWWVLLFIAAGAMEELLCRGYPFQLLFRWNRAAGLILPGVLFVVPHLSNEGGFAPVAVLNLLIVHGLFVVFYLRRRSLWLPIGVHIGWNVVQGNVFGTLVSGNDVPCSLLTPTWQQNLWTGYAFGPEGGLVVTCVLLMTAPLAWRCIKQQHPEHDLLAEQGQQPALPEADPIARPSSP